MKNIKNKITRLMIIVLIVSMNISGRNISALETDKNKKYSIEKIFFIGNARVPEKKIRELISLKENMKLTPGEIDFQIKLSRAKLDGSNLFIFNEINYEIRENGGIDLYISLGEKIIFLDMMALEQGGFIRFSSISEKSPDFGFMVGSKAQALYFRFPYLLKLPVDLATTITHHADKITYNPENPYDYEAVMGRVAIGFTFLQNFKIKVPGVYRYNILSDRNSTNSSDFSTGVESLIDFSHLKNVIYTGFDVYGGIYQGVARFSYTMSSIGLNLYFKPLKWEEIILRGRYNSVLQGNVPEYLLYRIDNEYQVRGKIRNQYYGRNSVILNAENWVHNIFTIPSAITNINFSLLGFVDLGTAADHISAVNTDTWNISVGGAISVEFSAPLNIALQAGYGYELWQNTGGQFYVKLGYEFRKGTFFE